jgi:hypothetical protein
MGPETWMRITSLSLLELWPLIIVGYLLVRVPVNLMIDTERPVLRRLVTVVGALVACRLFLSFPT